MTSGTGFIVGHLIDALKAYEIKRGLWFYLIMNSTCLPNGLLVLIYSLDPVIK